MSTIVSLVAARPETLAEDYRRAATMAGLGPASTSRPASLIATGPDPVPGFASPVWQAPLAMQALGLPPDCPLHHLPAFGNRPGRIASAAFTASGALLLPVPVLTVGWGVAQAVPTWLAAQGSPITDPRGGEETIRQVLEDAPRLLGCLADGILWGARPGSFSRTFIQRGVLMAGRDPVAVDAVAMALAGLDPLSFPWIQALQEAGLGIADFGGIRIEGDSGLLSAPFEAAPWTGAAGRDGSLSGRPGAMMWSFLRRRALIRSFWDSPWGGVAAAYP